MELGPNDEISSKFEVLSSSYRGPRPRNGRGRTSSKPLKVKAVTFYLFVKAVTILVVCFRSTCDYTRLHSRLSGGLIVRPERRGGYTVVGERLASRTHTYHRWTRGPT